MGSHGHAGIDQPFRNDTGSWCANLGVVQIGGGSFQTRFGQRKVGEIGLIFVFGHGLGVFLPQFVGPLLFSLCSIKFGLGFVEGRLIESVVEPSHNLTGLHLHSFVKLCGLVQRIEAGDTSAHFKAQLISLPGVHDTGVVLGNFYAFPCHFPHRHIGYCRLGFRRRWGGGSVGTAEGHHA